MGTSGAGTNVQGSMTRSTPALRSAPALALLILALAAVGCGSGDDAAAAPTTIPAATDGPAGPDVTDGPDVTVAVAAAADRSEATLPSTPTGALATPTPLAPTTALTIVTVPPTTARPTSTARPPSTTGTTATTLMTASSGQTTGQRLAGTVMASPTCPVERPDQPCPPSPVTGARIEVFDRGEHRVTTVDTDGEGRFLLVLAPGRYVLTASSGTMFPSCPQFTVDIPAAGDTRADILCDSGIR